MAFEPLPTIPIWRRVLAGSASAIIPGAGQLVVGSLKLGLTLLAAFGALLFFAFVGRGAGSLIGVAILCIAMFLLTLLGACLAFMPKGYSTKGAGTTWLPGILLLAMLCAVGWSNFLLYASGYRVFQTVSSSMAPTIKGGDRFVVDLRAYKSAKPQRDDLVVFEHGQTTLVKRLIGLPGDRISSRDGVISRNGTPLDEPYATSLVESPESVRTFDERTVPAGQVYLLGDNRDHSLDSRYDEFGTVKLTDIIGRTSYVLAARSRPLHWRSLPSGIVSSHQR